MTQQTNGMPELKYSEETFRVMYEALKIAQKLLREQYKILLGNYPKYGKMPELEIINKALASAEGK